MKLNEINLHRGQKLRRNSWDNQSFNVVIQEDRSLGYEHYFVPEFGLISIEDYLADDWVEE